jgi:hypothetical protein
MDWHTILEWTFLIAFWAGLAFTLGSALLSGAFHHEFGAGSSFEGGHAADLGGVEVGDSGSHAAAGHATVGWSDSNLPGASPWSPTVLAAAVAGFGGAGYLALVHWDTGNAGAVLLAIAGSVVMGGITFAGLWALFSKTQASSHVTASRLVGTKAPVQVTIESGRAGAIGIEAQGSRMQVPARAADASAIPVGAEVEIQKVEGGVYVVAETRESWVARSKGTRDHEKRWS